MNCKYEKTERPILYLMVFVCLMNSVYQINNQHIIHSQIKELDKKVIQILDTTNNKQNEPKK